MKISIPTCFFASLMTALAAVTVKAAKCPENLPFNIVGIYDIDAQGLNFKNYFTDNTRIVEIFEGQGLTFRLQSSNGWYSCARKRGGADFWSAVCASKKDSSNDLEMEFINEGSNGCTPTQFFFTDKRLKNGLPWVATGVATKQSPTTTTATTR